MFLKKRDSQNSPTSTGRSDCVFICLPEASRRHKRLLNIKCNQSLRSEDFLAAKVSRSPKKNLRVLVLEELMTSHLEDGTIPFYLRNAVLSSLCDRKH